MGQDFLSTFLNILNMEVFQIFYFIWMIARRTIVLVIGQVYVLEDTGLINEKLSQTFFNIGTQTVQR